MQPRPSARSGPIPPDMLLWISLLQQARREQNSKLEEYYLQAAESQGLDRQELLAHVQHRLQQGETPPDLSLLPPPP
jgi:hypothetical protein